MTPDVSIFITCERCGEKDNINNSNLKGINT